MHCFSQIPYVIISKIMRVSNSANERSLDAWADRLPLIGVCQEWRKVGTRLVYCDAMMDGYDQCGTGLIGRSEHSAIAGGIINTNIRLIKATGNTHMVKTLIIDVNYIQYYRSLVDKVDSIFSFERCDWSGVSKIIISGILKNDPHEGESQLNYLQDAQQFIKLITNNMPNVNTLDLSNSGQDGLGSAIIGILPGFYPHSLKNLSSYFPLLLTDSASFGQLTTLDIDANLQSTRCIPQICPQSLQKLTLRNVTPSFSWSKLVNPNKVDNIVFPNLHSLHLCFEADTFENYTQDFTRLRFPALEVLNITALTFDIMEHALNFDKFQWPSVTKLQLDLLEFSEDNSAQESNSLIQRSNNLAARIKHYMPRISQMRLGSYSSNNIEVHFYNRLANLYTEQLVRIHFNHPTTFTSTQFSRELTHLTLNAGSNTLQNLPRVFAESLRYLSLANLESTFTWDMLQQGSLESESMYFKQLERAHIGYQRIGTHNGLDYQHIAVDQKKQYDKLQVSCPRLKRLRVDNATINSLRHIVSCGPKQWLNVRNLNIRMIGSELAQNTDTDVQAIYLFANNFVKSMPNVNNLNMYSSSGGDFNLNCFGSIITNSYAHQLISYRSNIPVVLTIERFSPALRHLGINIGKANSSLLPKINATNIEQIDIQGNIDNFSWNSFADNNDSVSIMFRNLKNLTVDNSNKYYVDTLKKQDDITLTHKYPYTLHMPKLKKIYLCNIDDNSKLLNAFIDYIHIRNVNVGGSYKTLNLFASSKAGLIDSCHAFTKLRPNDNMDAFSKTLNRFFGDKTKIKHAELSLNMGKPKWSTQLISWTNLHSLNISQSIQFDTLVDLIARIPKLSDLSIDDITYDRFSEVELNRVRPILGDVSELCIFGTVTAVSKDIGNVCIKYLLLAFQSLKQLTLYGEEFDHDTFVKEYEEKYPHISDIKFE
ncbi:hypothetical protein BX661DRAFT_178062 [Kickxella alabastrina]|uniref:uncharacterized protein n=1 Tax=Kickxella alabastrina TaxID=61397 RepID=UPI00222098AA|nr:uncharacterized protein BX661DRAFT_178062 [Kickxella alabastrina]KAI7833279.1 hypothetical protein BX661DRAFT_178062 [Kickxella alabastrina]